MVCSGFNLNCIDLVMYLCYFWSWGYVLLSSSRILVWVCCFFNFMPLKVRFLGGTLVTSNRASGYCSGSVFTLRFAVSYCCDSVIENISTNFFNTYYYWIKRLLSGLIRCSVLSASINEWTALIAASDTGSLVIGKLVGKNLTVSEILLMDFLMIHILWHL